MEVYGTEIENNQIDVSNLMEFLNTWLLKHILGVDMRYAHFSRGERSQNVISLKSYSDHNPSNEVAS